MWYTAETSIRGLVTEADTLNALRERLMLIIPDFLEDQMPEHAFLHVTAESHDELHAVKAADPVAAE